MPKSQAGVPVSSARIGAVPAQTARDGHDSSPIDGAATVHAAEKNVFNRES